VSLRVDVCVCASVAVDSSDESASAAKNVTVRVVSIAGRTNSATPPPGDREAISDWDAASALAMTSDAQRLRELAAELGYWPASTDEEQVTRLRAQDARYDEHEDQDPGGDKWQKMLGSWVTQVKKSSVQE
jgi:hypothetical protein